MGPYDIMFSDDTPKNIIRVMGCLDEHELIEGVYENGSKKGERYQFFMIPTIVSNNNNNIEFTPKSFDNGDFDEINEFISNTIGIIRIINYSECDLESELSRLKDLEKRPISKTKHEITNHINNKNNK